MTYTVFGIVADQIGLASTTVVRQGALGPELRHLAWATPSSEIRNVQAATIPVDRDHDGVEVGRVVHLERAHGNLWAVAHVDDRVTPTVDVKVGPTWFAVETDLYWSASRFAAPGYVDIVLDSVALTASPARTTARPVRFLPGKLDYRGCTRRWSGLLTPHDRDLLERAADATHHRTRGEPIVVADRTPVERGTTAPYAEAARLEVRTATAIDVSRALREVDMVIAPAEQPTTIHEPARSYVEVFAHGAFAGCEAEPARVKVNRDHQFGRVLGRATRLDPWSEEGLVGTVKLARTVDADEALALIDDGLLGVSAGFGVPRDGDEWRDHHRHRRIRRAVLDHIGLTADPAYLGAEVVAVRGRQLAATR